MKNISVYYDSKTARRICRNTIQHSKMKHIDLRYRFIMDHVEDGNVEVHFVRSTFQLADIFTKALLETTFNYILHGICMIEVDYVPKSS